MKSLSLLLIVCLVFGCRENLNKEVYVQKVTEQDLKINSNSKKDFHVNLLKGDLLAIKIQNPNNSPIRIHFSLDENVVINKSIESSFVDSIKISKNGIYSLSVINSDTISVDYSIHMDRLTEDIDKIAINQIFREVYDTTHTVVENINFEIGPNRRKIVNFTLPENTDYWMYSIRTIDRIHEEKITSNGYLDNLINFGLKKIDRLPWFSSTQTIDCFFSDPVSTSRFSTGVNVERWNNFKMGNDVMKLNDIVSIDKTPGKGIGIAFENTNPFQLVHVAVSAISFNIDTLVMVER